jgi:hypothetical protein
MKNKLPIRNLPTEWVALGCALLAAAGLYAALIHPSLASVSALDKARLDRDAAVRELDEAQRQHQALLVRITDQKKQLDLLGGSPPSLDDREIQLARIAGIARECRLALDQYSPNGEVDTPDYSASYVQFAGRGAFLDVYGFFRRVEAEMDYVDITHFTLISAADPAKPADSTCVLTWSCKLSGMPRTPVQPVTPKPTIAAVTREVALHEP